MKFAIGRKQVIVSLADVTSESKSDALLRIASHRAVLNDRARRELNAMLSGASRLRTP